MTFNLRCATGERVHPWPERRPVVRRLLELERPHLLGTQEGLPDQLEQLAADLPDHYASVGEGREGGGRGEAMQVFYDSRRLRPVDHGHYWLSDTPSVAGSETWGGDCPRMVTWVRLTDLVAGVDLHVLNTHLDAFSASARVRSAELILRRTADLDPGVPVLVTGDFNEPAGGQHRVYDALVTSGPLVDTWVAAASRGPAYATFHDYGPLVADGDRIDWILASPDVAVRSAGVSTFTVDGRFPSDHLPVQAVVRLPTPD